MRELASVQKQAEEMSSWLTAVRRDFHRHPELSTKEERTRQQIIAYLEAVDIPCRTFAEHYGVVGIIEGGLPGKTVALRADMDALPIQDEKEAEYASIHSGVSHACGHDAHMTIQLGAAKILKVLAPSLKGTVRLIFQPAEETVGGAEPMIRQGVLENPKVDAIFGLHVTSALPSGSIGIKYGQMNGASDDVAIQVEGKSCHGAYPHQGVDAILIAGHLITQLQSVVSRSSDPKDTLVLTLGTIKGGTQENILADQVVLRGTLRTLSPQARAKALAHMERIVKAGAEALGGKAGLTIEPGYPWLINHDQMVDIVKENAQALLGEKQLHWIQQVSLGVEDFAYFLQQVPGTFYYLGSNGGEEKAGHHPAHSSLFDIDEDCLPIGAALQAANVLRFLNREK